ncbi:hypothetical protein N7495_003063 [Penicillium taxi]|uniref:uncharacterized protein n=1 Tax=Penicillium taxi TaxID=168475 RepID=UPI002544F80D|nr:uncharacterized protein N7495_003063 [Penicillium taxi]KAJ5902535.1 hypothetical protein N7495_003063 [Penicillium taxi]
MSPPVKANRKILRKPTQKATVIESAHKKKSQDAPAVDQAILDRIKKCLDRAYHPNASEAEARAAIFLSQKLMNQHNVSQADIMAKDDSADKAHFAGRSIVSITKTGGSSKRVMKETFVWKIARAMCTFFDCKHFSTDHITYMNWTFFGVASNTAAAAMSFEMAHNQIVEWACEYKGGTPTFNYRLGVADGLMAMAKREKKRELAQVQRKELDIIAAREREEEAERRKQVERLLLQPAPADENMSPDDEHMNLGSISPGPNMNDFYGADFDSDSGSDGGEERDNDDTGSPAIKADFDMNDIEIIDLTDDVDEAIAKLVKREPIEQTPTEIPDFKLEPDASIKSDAQTKREPDLHSIPAESPWNSGMQLVQFRETAGQVADAYLKQNSIKLRHHKKREPAIKDLNSYRQGQKDSSKIEIHDRHKPEAF